MRRSLFLSLVLLATVSVAQDKKAPRDADLGKKAATSVDKSLAGDISRTKAAADKAVPLQYDQFRLGVELQVASKRREQIESLKKIISLSADQKEAPSLHFRLGELYWEEAKFFFIEANRKDDDLIAAMNRNDAAGQSRAKADKAELLAQSKSYGKLAVEQYTKIVQEYPKFERTDEVLFFLGQYLMENGEDRKALVAYKRLIEKFPKSKYVPDAHLAFGEYYFNNSKGKREELEKALASYKKAAEYPENQVYAFALYKQGWCYFNLADYANAKDKFKTVVLYGELAGAQAVEKDGGKSGKGTLVREARGDFVRSYAREGDAKAARDEFGKVASTPEDRFTMLKQLANLYYEDGKDREAALTFNTLIKEKPLSPEAPGFQGKIVDCVLRMGNKERTVGQVRRLVKIMNDVESSGVIKSDKDKQALADARELSERTLSNLAVTWHNEGKKTRDEETFKYADMIYGDYLTLFPENPKAYDLRFFWAELLNDNLQQFEKAAENYTLVVLQDAKKLEAKDPKGKPAPQKAGKWLTNAAYNAVLAYDEVVKKLEESGQLKTETGSDIQKKVAIPGPKQALLDACERYIRYVPKGDKRVEIEFKAANIYYRYNHFDEAVLRFSEIALNYPEYKFENGERAAEIAANLILDSYNLLQDYAKVNEWARRFYNNDKLASGPFRDQLARLIEQSSFKLVNQLEAKGEFARAGDAYLTFVAEFPKSEIADKALYNASVDFFKAKMVDRSIQTRQRIIQSYPRSSFIPACIYANAEALEAIGDFSEAAEAYELYVRGYERSIDAKGGMKSGGGASKAAHARARAQASRKKAKAQAAAAAEPEKKDPVQVWEEPKAQVALFNAATYRDGLGQYKAALKDREHFLELWPKSKDAESVFLSIADLYEKSGAYGRALKQLEDYEREYMRSPSKVLEAEGRIAAIYEQKLRRPREANRIYNRVYDYFEKLPRRIRKELDKPALAAVARAHMLRIEPDYAQFARLRLSWGRPASPEAFKASIKEKKKALDVVQRLYVETVQLGAADSGICALHRLGLAYDNFADKVINAPMPPGTDEAMRDALKEQFTTEAQPLKDQATEALKSAVAKGHELDVYNDCFAKSLQLLRTTYAPEQFPEVPEDKLPLLNVKHAVAVEGGGLLSDIQPVPAATVQAPQKAAESQDLREDLEALTKQLRAKQASTPAAERTQTPDAKTASDKAKKADSEEPEDFL
ncbi:tetratricopeptide repeat protein [Aggregicoccus sp. 17bor-14]|uniref:tetratricopeptide repeat protein n=1 Tax=Myxococcaceae TaxID=31 RepID=UPI00129CD74F|nr:MULTISPECIES: tetratricopeptide repeat protein [Myxococcaceae]MBF5042506.1 tetratricopeptide repeat protein [Simulacricoccus sp. 17bor-14]MRI88276.1 tetratricopeptide repeat protein [Aggregicoccus sp. 17bor-14]